MERKSFEQAWVEIYNRAKVNKNEYWRKRAERKLIQLGVIDDQIAEEALIETYETISTH